MKARRKFFGLLLALVLCAALTGCGSAGGGSPDAQAKAAARKLLTEFYTVDAKASAAFDPKGMSAAQIDSLHQKFRAALTQKEYAAFISNRTFLRYVASCRAAGATIALQSITLTKVDDPSAEQGGAMQYDYAAVFRVTSSGHSSVQRETGEIGLIRQAGAWKVNYLDISGRSDFTGAHAG